MSDISSLSPVLHPAVPSGVLKGGMGGNPLSVSSCRIASLKKGQVPPQNFYLTLCSRKQFPERNWKPSPMPLCLCFLQLLQIFHSQQDSAQQICQQLGWQETLARLFLKENADVRNSLRDSRRDSAKEDDRRAPSKEFQKRHASKADAEDATSFASVNGVCDQWSLEDGKPVAVFEDLSVAEISFRPEDPEELWQKNPSHLSLDLSSVDSYELGDAGNQTVDSLPSTPSPSESTKPFSGQLDKEPNVTLEVASAADLSLFEITEVCSPSVPFQKMPCVGVGVMLVFLWLLFENAVLE